MKKSIFIFCALAVFSLAGTTAFAQCEAEKYTEKLIEKMPDGYAFLKSYKIDGENGNKSKMEFPYIFSKDSNYMITLANKDVEIKGVILTLYDSNRKPVATNLDPGSKKFYSGVSYKCATTGVYYLTFSFESTKDYCAAAVLGFKR
jgi:hypothetical protein